MLMLGTCWSLVLPFVNVLFCSHQGLIKITGHVIAQGPVADAHAWDLLVIGTQLTFDCLSKL
jgi:hypothetical protein